MSLNPSLFTSRRPVGYPLAGITVLLAVLTACGGGDATTPVPDTPVATNLDLTGTAAVGKALAGATVSAKCAAGTGTATAATDGVFSLRISGGALPCVLQAVSGSTTLHSVATGTGRSATANITPLTELVVAQANGGDAATLFGSFDAAARDKVTPAALSAATTSVQTALASVVDIAGVNPFTDTLVAASGSTAGNALDAKLDTLGTKLGAAKLTLAQLISTIARNGSSAATVVASQVQPAASHCASLRSGSYSLIDMGAENESDRVRRITIDAIAMTVREADGTVRNAEAVAGKPCHYTSEEGRTNTVVSPAGVLLHHIVPGDGSPARLAVSLPAQNITPAQLEGTWNTVELGYEDSSLFAVNSYANVVIDATGKLTALNDCKYMQPCVAATGGLPAGFKATTGGGLYVEEDDGSATRFFAYRAPSGDMMLIGVSSSIVIVGARQAPLSLPAVGETLTYWDVALNNRFGAGDLVADVRSITAANAVEGTYSRGPSYNGFTDSIRINTPRPGMRVRESCTSSTGTVTTCGTISMPLPGMGITVHGRSTESTGGGFLDIAVLRPAGSEAKGVQASAAGAAALGTLVYNGGETYPLRVNLTVDANGQITGGNYDFHKVAGTMTPCTFSQDNASTCFGTNGGINTTSQGGALRPQGAAGTVSLRAGPDTFGFVFTGTVTGTVWSGTWAQAASSSNGNVARSGTFAVNLVITQQ